MLTRILLSIVPVLPPLVGIDKAGLMVVTMRITPNKAPENAVVIVVVLFRVSSAVSPFHPLVVLQIGSTSS